MCFHSLSIYHANEYIQEVVFSATGWSKAEDDELFRLVEDKLSEYRRQLVKDDFIHIMIDMDAKFVFAHNQSIKEGDPLTPSISYDHNTREKITTKTTTQRVSSIDRVYPSRSENALHSYVTKGDHQGERYKELLEKYGLA